MSEAVELRTHFEVVAPSNLQAEDGRDRPWGGAISFGIHSTLRYGQLHMCLGPNVHFIGKLSGFTQFQQDLHKGLGIKHAGDAVVNNQIKYETFIGGAAEVSYPIGVMGLMQARPFGEMRTRLEDVALVGVDVYFGAVDSTPAMSRESVTGHRYPVNVEHAQDRGMLFSPGYDHTQMKKLRFLQLDLNASHEPARSRIRMGMTFKSGSWSVFRGLTIMGKESRDQDANRFWDLFASLASFNSDDLRFLSLSSMQSPRGMPSRHHLTGVQSLPLILI